MFCKQLRAVRMARKITQQKLSDTLGIALRTYQGYEQGEREPSLETLVKIADILNVPTDYLLCRDLSLLRSFDGFQ
ncbi:MAG: helix-turn-helix transcriptional regulator [Lawsonibacter sp.]|jgi:transcriptional regulator with XRE-family HTH domain|nr:helix-turn-helix transcriptional regulator [Lawsonibacter sp.]